MCHCFVNYTNLLFFIIRLECIQSKGNSLILQVMLLKSSNTRLIRMWSRKLPLPLPLSVERIKSEMPWFQIEQKKGRALELVCRNMMTQGPHQWQRLTPSNTSFTPMCQQTTQGEEKCSCREAFQRSSAAFPPTLEGSQTEVCFWGYCFFPCRGFLFRASIVWKATALNDPRVSREDATPLIPKQPQTELWDFCFQRHSFFSSCFK